MLKQKESVINCNFMSGSMRMWANIFLDTLPEKKKKKTQFLNRKLVKESWNADLQGTNLTIKEINNFA